MGWPLITYWLGYTSDHGTPPGLLLFFWRLLLDLNPVLLPVLLLGLCYLLFHSEGKKYRPLGLSFLILLVFYCFLKLDPRIFVSACFPLLGAGAVWLEKIFIGVATSSQALLHGKRTFSFTPWLVRIYFGVILISSVLLAPLFLPFLPVDALEKYIAATPRFIRESLNNQGFELLPSHFSFRFGWTELVQKVAEVYHRLPEAEREHCAIWTEFYMISRLH